MCCPMTAQLIVHQVTHTSHKSLARVKSLGLMHCSRRAALGAKMPGLQQLHLLHSHHALNFSLHFDQHSLRQHLLPKWQAHSNACRMAVAWSTSSLALNKLNLRDSALPKIKKLDTSALANSSKSCAEHGRVSPSVTRENTSK